MTSPPPGTAPCGPPSIENDIGFARFGPPAFAYFLSIIRGGKILCEMPSKLKNRTHAGSVPDLGSCRRQRFIELEFFCCPLHRPLRGALKRVKNGKRYLIPA